MKHIVEKLYRRCIPALSGSSVFRFSDVSARSLSMIELGIQTPESIPPLHILLDVVYVEMPALISLTYAHWS